jgi:hypothetical protein
MANVVKRDGFFNLKLGLKLDFNDPKVQDSSPPKLAPQFSCEFVV